MERMMAELKEAFHIHNRGDQNKISKAELGHVLRSIGLTPTQAQLATIAQEYGSASGRGDEKQFTFQDCERIVQKYAGMKETKETVRDCFRIFDKDGTGYNSASELRHVLTTLGEPLQDEDIDQLIREVELTVDGQVNYEEMVNILMGSS